MGADISLESKPGVGSVFSFTLRLEKGTAESNVVQEESQLALQAGAHILIVDDNPVNQVVAGKQLKTWGLTCSFANNGELALSLITQKTFDVILMDLRMPVMDGYEASRRIRSLKDEYYQKIPIIALSASVTGKVRSKVLAAGMQDYISKPFAPETLRKALSQFIPATQAISPAFQKPTITASTKLAEFTAGDINYKKELAVLISNNLRELSERVIESNQAGNSELFRMAEHKMASSLMILGVDELNQILADMKRTFAHSNTISPKTMNTFNQIIARILQELEAEAK